MVLVFDAPDEIIQENFLTVFHNIQKSYQPRTPEYEVLGTANFKFSTTNTYIFLSVFQQFQ